MQKCKSEVALSISFLIGLLIFLFFFFSFKDDASVPARHEEVGEQNSSSTSEDDGGVTFTSSPSTITSLDPRRAKRREKDTSSASTSSLKAKATETAKKDQKEGHTEKEQNENLKGEQKANKNHSAELAASSGAKNDGKGTKLDPADISQEAVDLKKAREKFNQPSLTSGSTQKTDETKPSATSATTGTKEKPVSDVKQSEVKREPQVFPRLPEGDLRLTMDDLGKITQAMLQLSFESNENLIYAAAQEYMNTHSKVVFKEKMRESWGYSANLNLLKLFLHAENKTQSAAWKAWKASGFGGDVECVDFVTECLKSHDKNTVEN